MGSKAALKTSKLGEPIVKIQQSIPSGSIIGGPHAIVRSANLNDAIEIRRRFGEGSKPLFDREDIAVNQPALDTCVNNAGNGRSSGYKSKLCQKSSSSDTSSPERYRHRDKKRHSTPTTFRRKSPERSGRNEQRPNRDKHIYSIKYSDIKTDKYKRKEKSKSRSSSPVKKKRIEKIPYFRDEKREKDRLLRLYGSTRSRTPPYSSSLKRRIESPHRRRRSSSRERYRRPSPYHSSKRDYRNRRSRTRSRTRSPQRRDRHKQSSRSSRERDKEHRKESKTLATAVMPATPQFIPIPVAVPSDYAAFSFPGWTAPQPSWHPHHRSSPAAHFAPFPMLPIMPPIRPPHQASYGSMPPSLPYATMSAPYRAQAHRYPIPRHYSNAFQSWPKKPSG